jgi:metallo-beta-lactamase class B
MIPVRDHGRTVVLSLLGGTVFPTVRQPNNRSGGQLQWDGSIRRLAGLAERHHAVGLLNTHPFADGGEARMAALREKGDGGPNPFVIGTPSVMRYYAVVDHCVKAALARPENPNSPIGTSFPED